MCELLLEIETAHRAYLAVPVDDRNKKPLATRLSQLIQRQMDVIKTAKMASAICFFTPAGSFIEKMVFEKLQDLAIKEARKTSTIKGLEKIQKVCSRTGRAWIFIEKRKKFLTKKFKILC
jgi:hypothetical protein